MPGISNKHNGHHVDIKLILQKIASGDKQAYAQIVTRFQGSLFGFLGRMSVSQAVAEELAQETFLRAWSDLGQYRPEVAEFSTWLFTIARNLALNELERSMHKHIAPVIADAPEAVCERLQPPEELVLRQEQLQLHSALLKLPMTDRSALALAYVQELDMVAIARIEACSVAVIKTRLHRAKEKLRQLLEQA